MPYDRNTAVELRVDTFERSTHVSGRRISPTLTARWFAQLSVMLRAGIPLTQVLAAMLDAEPSARWRTVQTALLDDLRSGVGFSEAVANHPAVFDPLTVRLIATGEQTGQLDPILAALAQSLEQRVALHAKLRQALVYPASVLVVALGISIFMLLFVVPQFATLFVANNATLPWLTVQLLNASDFLRTHAVLVLSVITMVILTLWVTRSTWLNLVVARMPIARTIWLNAAIARWSGTLVLTLRAGLPFLEGFALACANAQHPRFVRQTEAWTIAIEDGASLRRALGDGGIFLPWTLQMLAMGQESGQLDILLEKIRDFHLDAVNRTVSTFSTLLEPVVMIVIGSVVGTLLLAMYLPIFELSNAIG